MGSKLNPLTIYVACVLDHPIMNFASHITRQFQFPIAYVDKYLHSLFFVLRYLLRIFFLPFYVQNSCSYSFPCKHLPLLVGQARAHHVLLVAAKNTRLDQPFSLRNLIREYGAYLDPQPVAAMYMNGDSASVWDIEFGAYISLVAWKKRWWHWGGCGDALFRYFLSGVNTPLSQCFREFNYRKALRKLVVVAWQSATSEIPPDTQVLGGKSIFSHLALEWSDNLLS